MKPKLCLQLEKAHSDKDIQDLLLSDEGLDLLEIIGYQGVPSRETVASAGNIVQ